MFYIFLFFSYLYRMKKWFILIALNYIICSCSGSKNGMASTENNPNVNDTIRIANDELEYEIIIIEPGFNSWLLATAKPRNYYDQSYLENRNRIWVVNYNQRVFDRNRYDPMLYEMQIEYQNNINYGYEVNYILYNYFVYFQQKYKQKLGGFEPRL